MRSLLLIPVLFSLLLAGCATSGTTTNPVTPTQVSTVITDVQAAVATGCNIAVQAQSIASILSAVGVPYVGMVADIAGQVCGAFNRPGAKHGKAGAVRSVVVVRGHAIAVQGRRL